MVDGGEPGVDSRDEGKHTGRNAIGTSSIGSIDSPFSSSITLHSFIPGLKSSFSTTTSHRNLLFLLQD